MRGGSPSELVIKISLVIQEVMGSHCGFLKRAESYLDCSDWQDRHQETAQNNQDLTACDHGTRSKEKDECG